MVLFSSTRHVRRRLHRRREDGYVLLTLLLIVALMSIVALTVAVPIKFDLRRDREQEMIHRGVQYSRAIRIYYKKFGRYPTRLEDLDNTNNLRYLRKHFKDPVTGKDFKLLHYGDPGVSLTGSVGSTPIAGANTVEQLNGSGANSSALSGSAFGGNSGSAFGGSGVNSSGVFSQSSSFGGNSNSAFGPSSSQTAFGPSSSQTPSAQPGTNAAAGSDPSSQTVSQTPGTAPGDASSSTQQVFGGGPIVGVASASKDTTIREFNHKRKYNEWQFVYDPTTDRGGLLLTPNQPLLQMATQPLNGQPANGQPGNSNTNGSSFGQPTGFGNNNPGLMGGPTTPQQPPANPPPPQQQ
jgi:type II secretory pathway pseudopilin PulG